MWVWLILSKYLNSFDLCCDMPTAALASICVVLEETFSLLDVRRVDIISHTSERTVVVLPSSRTHNCAGDVGSPTYLSMLDTATDLITDRGIKCLFLASCCWRWWRTQHTEASFSASYCVFQVANPWLTFALGTAEQAPSKRSWDPSQ